MLVVVRLFSNKSHRTPKFGKNKNVAHEVIAECVTAVLINIFTVIPYVQGASDRAGSILKSFNICTTLKPCRTLGRIIKKPKAGPVDHQRTGIIYKVKCDDRSVKYLGKRSRSPRGAEHDPGGACKAESPINNTRTKN